MKGREVAHLWANKSRSSAKASNFYFNGDTIYSYGSHSPIARHHKAGCVLMTTQTYSRSTSRHIGYVRSASHHLTTFHVEDPTKEPSKADVLAYRDRIIAQAKLVSVRKIESTRLYAMGELEKLVNEANEFCAYFKFKTRFEMPSDFEALKAEVKKENEKRRKADALKQKQIEKDNTERVEAWLRGESDIFPYSISKVYLRTITRPDESESQVGSIALMQTSKHATVPMAEAERAFKFCIKMRERGWHRNGETFKVGDYHLDAVNEQGIVAGCHRIDWETIESFAKQVGWV